MIDDGVVLFSAAHPVMNDAAFDARRLWLSSLSP